MTALSFKTYPLMPISSAARKISSSLCMVRKTTSDRTRSAGAVDFARRGTGQLQRCAFERPDIGEVRAGRIYRRHDVHKAELSALIGDGSSGRISAINRGAAILQGVGLSEAAIISERGKQGINRGKASGDSLFEFCDVFCAIKVLLTMTVTCAPPDEAMIPPARA